jgi:hypothetical protein
VGEITPITVTVHLIDMFADIRDDEAWPVSPRVVIAGHLHHVTQRGNGGARTLFSDSDYALHRNLLGEHCRARILSTAWRLRARGVLRDGGVHGGLVRVAWAVTERASAVATVGVGHIRGGLRQPACAPVLSAVFLEGVAVLGLFPYLAFMLVARGEGHAAIADIVLSGFALGGIAYAVTWCACWSGGCPNRG